MKPQQMPRPKAKGPRSKSYGDENFKGLGILTCYVCNKPLRDHKRVGPCPELKGRDIRLTSPKRAYQHNDKEKR